MSRSNLLKMLLLSFFVFIVLPFQKVLAFTGGGKWSYYNSYISDSSKIPDYDNYKYFYDCMCSTSSVYTFELDKLQVSDRDLTYQIDFPSGTNFKKFQFITGSEQIFYSLNHCSDSSVHMNGAIQYISYGSYSNFDDCSDGRVCLSIQVPSGSSGLFSFKFTDTNGVPYNNASPCSIEEQTVSQAFKELNGYDYGGEPPKEEPPKEEPPKDEPSIKPPSGGLDSLPIDSTSTDTVIESIIEGLKTFFSWLLKFLVPIILGAVALGVIVKGAKWLWSKAKGWVSSS